MQKARGHPKAPTACRHMVSGTFHSPCRVLFIVQSPYWFTIGRRGVFSLRGWTPHVRTEFHGLRTTRGLADSSLQDCHLLWSTFPGGS